MNYGSADRYREMEVQAMSPAKRLVLLYAHLLVALKQARRHIAAGEIEARCDTLIRAEEIVHELSYSLDREAGGDFADRLAGLYAWMLGQFAAIQSKPDITKLDAVTAIVTELHEAWSTAAAQLAEPVGG
jgi:flagellar secretion chaperone FliS